MDLFDVALAKAMAGGSGGGGGGSGGDDHIVWGTISIDEDSGAMVLSMTWQEITDALLGGKLVKFIYAQVYAEDSYTSATEYDINETYIDTEHYVETMYVAGWSGDRSFFADSPTGEMTDSEPDSRPIG